MLIFVHSRKETYKTAKFLQEEAMRNDDLAKFVPGSSASREVLQVQSDTTLQFCSLLHSHATRRLAPFRVTAFRSSSNFELHTLEAAHLAAEAHCVR